MKINLNFMVFIQEVFHLKTKVEVYILNPEKYESIGTHCIALYVNDNM